MTNDALPAGAGIGRVALRVADLEETVAFYEETIGLEGMDPDSVAGTTPEPEEGKAVLGADDEPLLVLEHAPDASPRSPSQAGLYHVAIRVPDRRTLGAAIVRLHDRDLIDGAADHGVSEAIYLRDPEGNGLEIYVDRPREAWPIEDDRVEMVTDPLDLDELAGLASGPSTDAAEPPTDAPDSPAGAAGPTTDSDDGTPSLPAGTTIGHVHLEVSDLEPTRSFYADALGMGVRQRMGDQALFLAAGDYHHHVGANTWRRRSEPAGEDTLGLTWFEVVVPSDGALDDAAVRLEEAGVAVDRERDGEVLAVADPDGIRLQLRVDTTIATTTGE